MGLNSKIKQFLLPMLTRWFFLRLLLVAFTAYLFFGHICIPLHINGNSMEPTYSDGGINFCWRLYCIFSRPKRYDVVVVRLAGQKVMLLKRVVALEGEVVEFRKGRLFVDGQEMDESHVHYPCDWNLAPRQVGKDRVYIVGDNRDVPIDNHVFGQTSVKRIIGTSLW